MAGNEFRLIDGTLTRTSCVVEKDGVLTTLYSILYNPYHMRWKGAELKVHRLPSVTYGHIRKEHGKTFMQQFLSSCALITKGLFIRDRHQWGFMRGV